MKNPLIIKFEEKETEKIEKLQKLFGDNKPQTTIRKIINSFEIKNEVLKNEN